MLNKCEAPHIQNQVQGFVNLIYYVYYLSAGTHSLSGGSG